MKKLSFIFCAGAVFILVLSFFGISSAEGDLKKVPITTSSEEAKQLYLKGLDMDDNIRNQEARELYKQALEIDPDFALAQLYLAVSEVTFVDYLDGINKANALKDKVSDGEKLLIEAFFIAANNTPMEIRKKYEKLVELYPDDERAHNFLALNFYGQQEYEDAIKHLNEALKINPDFAPAYNMVGYAYEQLEKYEDAEKAFQKYIELIPDNPNPYDSYAEFLLKMGRFDESIEYYQKALAVKPDFNISHFGIATNYCMKGDYQSAHAELEKAYGQAKDDGERRAALVADAIVFVDERKHDKAMEVLEKRYQLIAQKNDSVTMSNDCATMGFLLVEMDQLDKAAVHFTNSRDLIVNADAKEELKEQAEANYLFNMATIHIKNGDFKKAKTNAQGYMAYATKVQNLNSKRAAHQLIGMIALAEKDYNRAKVEFEQANLQSAYNVFRLARACEGNGDIERAKELYNKASTFNAVNNFFYALVRKKAEDKLQTL